jgi:putative ABC transport system permease protein
MSLRRQVIHGLRVLANRKQADEDLSDELGHFVEEARAELIAQGVSPEEAGRAARLEAGSELAVRDLVRAGGWEYLIDTFLADIRYGARRLRLAPGFSLTCIVILAIGIGASTAIFSAVSPVLFESLPYPDAHRVVAVWDYAPGRGPLEVTFGTHREVLERSRTFEALAVFKPWQPTVTGAREPERLDGQRVSVDYFRALGVVPALGRDFSESDDVVRGPALVLLSDGLWRRRFNGDPAIVGQQIMLDDVGHEVIGVMPRSFENVPSPAADVWGPLQYDASLPTQGREWGHHLRMLGRLRADVAIQQARQELHAIAAAPLAHSPRAPWASLAYGLTVTTLQEDMTRAVKPALLAVLGAVLLVLVMACVNVANLVLARGMRRRAEFAMRTALGAARTRLLRQVLTEGLLLAAIGGALGTIVAVLGVRMLVVISPPGLPRVGAIGVNGNALLFACVATAIIGFIVGALPLRYASPARMHAGLRSSRQIAGGHRLARRALVLAEVALAVTLLASAGLLVRTLRNLFAISPGFATENVLTMQVQASGSRLANEQVHRFFEKATDAARDVPGVAAAAFVSQLPLSGDRNEFGATFEQSAGAGHESGHPVFRYAVSPGYFETLRIPLRSGRLLDQHDTANTLPVVVISESFARKVPGASPLGQRLYIGQVAGATPYTVVGIVGDVVQTSLAAGTGDAVYVTPRQWHFADRALWLVARTHGDAARLAPAIREAIWSVDSNQPVLRIAAMADVLRQSAGERWFALTLFQAFGAAALLLVATGLYGVIANGVGERTSEIGVRLALGASRGSILALVVREGMAVVIGGVAIGLVGAAAAGSAMMSLLFRVSPLDPATYVSVVALLIGVSVIACGLPAWRALRVDPSMTLRAE